MRHIAGLGMSVLQIKIKNETTVTTTKADNQGTWDVDKKVTPPPTTTDSPVPSIKDPVKKVSDKPGKPRILHPTCLSGGHKEIVCTRKGCPKSYGDEEICGSYLSYKELPALGHSYNKGTSIKTGKKRGKKFQYQKTQKCKRCGNRKISFYYK